MVGKVLGWLCVCCLVLCATGSAQEMVPQTELIKKHKVKSCTSYLKAREKEGEVTRTIHSVTTYNDSGRETKLVCYGSDGTVGLEHIREYFPEGLPGHPPGPMSRLTKISNGTDTTVTVFPDCALDQISIITGGLPDFFPDPVYYQNGLLKSENVMTDCGPGVMGCRLEYVYTYYP